MMFIRKQLMMATSVVVMVMAGMLSGLISSTPASATAVQKVHTSASSSVLYQRFLPGGLPQVSPAAAEQAVIQYADVNSTYASKFAEQASASSYVASQYASAGWGTAPAGTLNSAETSTGGIVAYNDASSVGVKTIRILNQVTGVIVNVMVRCGNLRVRQGVTVVNKVVVQKILRIWVDKKFSIKKTTVCPVSKQPVTVNVTGTVKGWATTTVSGWATEAQLYYNQQVDLKVQLKVSVLCGAVPAPAPTSTTTAPAATCPNGTASNGSCNSASSSAASTSENTCGNGASSSATNCSASSTSISITNQCTANNSPGATVCSAPPSTTPPTTPTPTSEIVNVTFFNDVPAGEAHPSFTVEVTTSVPETLTISDNTGSFNTSTTAPPDPAVGTVTFQVSAGTTTETLVYWASKDPSVTSDTITVSLTGDSNQSVHTFTIDQPSSNPRPSE